MANNWKPIRLKDVIHIKHGFAFKGKHFCDYPTPKIVLTPGNFQIGGGFKADKFKYYKSDFPDEYILHENDLIVTMTDLSKEADTLGYPALIPHTPHGRYLHNQRLGLVQIKDQAVVDKYFLYYLLCSKPYRDEILANYTGTTVKHTSPTKICLYSFQCPPFETQEAIAHILGTLDEKIELNRRMNATLESMAAALFKSWFIDFDPTRAKAAGDPTAGNLPKNIAKLFPNSLEDSPLGKIPKGWNSGTLADVIDIHDKKRIPLNSRQRAERPGPYRYYGAAGIMDNVDDYLFDGIYVLVGEDGSVIDKDNRPITQYVWGKFWVNNHAHILSGRNGVCKEHLYILLRNTNIRPFVTGAVQPKVNQKNLKAIPLVLSDNEVSERFSQFIEPLFCKIRENSDETEILERIRDTLLPKLLSGELDVSGLSLPEEVL